MTIHCVEDGNVEVQTAPLIRGDGVDLVVKRIGRRSISVQLSIVSARQLADNLRFAAIESEKL
jgi:hypothetical protein